MSHGNEEEKMETEYDIRGGVRGKYFAQYQEMVVTRRVEVRGVTDWWIQTQTTSIGEHSAMSTLSISVDAAYQTQMPVTVSEILAPAA